MIETLNNTKLFAGYEKSSLIDLESAVSLRHVKKNEILFYEKDPASAFFIVEKGKVKVYKVSPEGKEQILMIASDGDSFAEAAMFAGGAYPACAQALEDSKVVVVNRERFVTVLEKNPTIALNLITRLSELLHKLNRLVEELSLTDITTRLAYYIVTEIEKISEENPPDSLTLAEKKSVLASQLGTIPETLSRSFAKLSREKVITVDGANIKIHDLDKLYQIAGLE